MIGIVCQGPMLLTKDIPATAKGCTTKRSLLSLQEDILLEMVNQFHMNVDGLNHPKNCTCSWSHALKKQNISNWRERRLKLILQLWGTLLQQGTLSMA
jgi:hypothetical protein